MKIMGRAERGVRPPVGWTTTYICNLQDQIDALSDRLIDIEQLCTNAHGETVGSPQDAINDQEKRALLLLKGDYGFDVEELLKRRREAATKEKS